MSNLKLKKYFVLCEPEVLQDKRLTANDKLVYSFIRGFWNSGHEFTGSNSYIADSLGLSRRSVIRSLERLQGFECVACLYDPTNIEKREIKPYKVLKPKTHLRELFNLVWSNLGTGEVTFNDDRQEVELSPKLQEQYKKIVESDNLVGQPGHPKRVRIDPFKDRQN